MNKRKEQIRSILWDGRYPKFNTTSLVNTNIYIGLLLMPAIFTTGNFSAEINSLIAYLETSYLAGITTLVIFRRLTTSILYKKITINCI